jgi:hypothetical protein
MVNRDPKHIARMTEASRRRADARLFKRLDSVEDATTHFYTVAREIKERIDRIEDHLGIAHPIELEDLIVSLKDLKQ